MSGSGLAPSEKHLEDYVWEHPRLLVAEEYSYDYRYQMLFRQFPLPSGRVDLIMFDGRICIAELKKGMITAQSLTQLLRYMRDFKDTIQEIALDLLAGDKSTYWSHNLWSGDSRVDTSELLYGLLIGHDVENKNLVIACESCDVDVMLYDYTEKAYIFHGIDDMDRWGGEEYSKRIRSLSHGPFAQRFIEVFTPEIERVFIKHAAQHNAAFNAIRAAEDFLNGGGS